MVVGLARSVAPKLRLRRLLLLDRHLLRLRLLLARLRLLFRPLDPRCPPLRHRLRFPP